MIQYGQAMSAEQKPTLIIVSGPNKKIPPSERFQVVYHSVNFDNSFRAEVSSLCDTMQDYTSKDRLAGIGPGGLVTVAAFAQNDTWHPPEDEEKAIRVATFGTRFHPDRIGPAGDRFEREGMAWLTGANIAPVLKENIATVIWEKSLFMSERAGTLDGVKKKIILAVENNGSPLTILESSLDSYFQN